MRGDDTTPACASESIAKLKLEPAGIDTRTRSPRDEPPHALTTASAAVQVALTSRRLTWKRERMLQEYGGGHGIDVSLAAAGRAAHVANGPERRGGREPLVHETHGQTSSFLQLRGDVSRFDRPRGVIPLLIKWQANDESFHLEFGTAPDHLGNWRPFPSPSLDEAGG